MTLFIRKMWKYIFGEQYKNDFGSLELQTALYLMAFVWFQNC